MKVNVREVVRKQLLHTADQLMSLRDHDHMSDDCGDYIMSAMDAGYELWNAFFLNDGDPESVGKELLRMSTPANDGDECLEIEASYACDGISEELISVCRAIAAERAAGREVEFDYEGYFPETVDENVRWIMR